MKRIESAKFTYRCTADQFTVPANPRKEPRLQPAGPLGPSNVRAFDDNLAQSIGVDFPWPPGLTRARLTVHMTARAETTPTVDCEIPFLLTVGPTTPINVRDPIAARVAMWLAEDPDHVIPALADDVLHPLKLSRGSTAYVIHTFGPYEVEIEDRSNGLPAQLLATRIPCLPGFKSVGVLVVGLNIDVESL